MIFRQLRLLLIAFPVKLRYTVRRKEANRSPANQYYGEKKVKTKKQKGFHVGFLLFYRRGMCKSRLFGF